MLDAADQAQLVSLLKQLEAGFLPYDVFVQIARLTTLSIVEFVPVRTHNGVTEVLLMERDANDDIWPGEIHTPGTVIRPTDTESDRHKPFERILNDELLGTKVSDPYYVGSTLHIAKRGTEQAQIFWVEVLEEPRVGVFYPANNLPDNLIESQINFINQAVRSYEQR